jgi:hypothetical protein
MPKWRITWPIDGICRRADLPAWLVSAPLEIVKRIGMLALVAVLTATGCGSQKPTAAPPATPANLIEFTVDGGGPYQLGATLASLQTAGSLDEVTPGGAACPENTTARGKDVWKDVRLSFRKDGKLYLIINKSASIPTPSGVWLGTTLADLKKIYAGVTGEELTRATGTAYLITTLSGGGILFDLDANKKVISMAAGDAASLKSTYVGSTQFC